MKEYDFVFIYEVKNRELDSVLLMKCELERRGYSVYLVETWERDIIRTNPVIANVAVCFALYNDDIFRFVRQFVKNCNKFVNLQWEQINTNGTEISQENDSNDAAGFYGVAKKAVHISWGQYNYWKLTQKYGIDAKLVRICGNVNLDFLRDEFRSLYLSRDEMEHRYSMEGYESLYLFISSFSYADLPETILDQDIYKNQSFDVKKHCELSYYSRIKILEWFERELRYHPKTLIIYRPHPAEKNSDVLKNLEKQYSNFRVYGDLSIRQWILIADKIYMWWSTSIAEVFLANKGCEILRPMSLPYVNELQIYKEARFIKTFEEFDRTFDSKSEFPINSINVERFYNIDKNTPSFIRVCNVLEEVLGDDNYSISELEYLAKPYPYWRFHNFKRRVMSLALGNDYVFRFLRRILGQRIIKSGKTIETYKREYDYAMEMISKNRYIDDEVSEKTKVIKLILERYYK
ncbi:MAG: hypothetical protein J5525_04865 [Lachnospiraceae bacterium]|nr:hypothetical protein [Lachnospiraceae bacterium]